MKIFDMNDSKPKQTAIAACCKWKIMFTQL